MLHSLSFMLLALLPASSTATRAIRNPVLRRIGIAPVRKAVSPGPRYSGEEVSNSLHLQLPAFSQYSISSIKGLRLIHAQGFGSDEPARDRPRSVRIMTTMELTAELESYGLNTEDCEDRHDLEKKLIGARRGSYREGKIKTSRDAGGYLQAQDSKGPGLQSGITSASQENKAAAFDEAMSTTMRQRANSFDAAIQDKLASIEKRGQKVFDLLEYPCEHEIKIVGAKAMKIGKYG
mmetsp:Transcript_4466/g.6333  ORF Transcript_4466/g.6333 Transcript_4466/m.6333 type:complete len:235 (-) Transcript_4466:51-755(-)